MRPFEPPTKWSQTGTYLGWLNRLTNRRRKTAISMQPVSSAERKQRRDQISLGDGQTTGKSPLVITSTSNTLKDEDVTC